MQDQIQEVQQTTEKPEPVQDGFENDQDIIITNPTIEKNAPNLLEITE